VRLLQEHRGEYPSLWTANESIAPKIIWVPQTLLDWVKQAEVDSGALLPRGPSEKGSMGCRASVHAATARDDPIVAQ
jgi:hypothetical protein